jgi:glycosyltransferase involved in cell wall biosynthesis
MEGASIAAAGMKLLVVGHSYLTAFAQGKYAAMKRADPDLRLRLVIPPRMAHPFKLYTAERHAALSEEEVVVIPSFFGRTHMTYVLNPVRLFATLRSFDPDHIHIEEDPHSLVGVETVALARWASPRATISFFIWDNLARTPQFPVGLIKAWFTRYALSRASMVICGNAEAERLLKTAKGFTGPTAVLPQLGIDEADYASPVAEAIYSRFRSGGPWIGFLGRLVPEKGVTILLEALSHQQHLPWSLLLVGNGPLRREIDAKWQPIFGARLLCLDAVSHGEIPDYLKSIDIFVLPSYSIEGWKEQFGLTLAQAMLAGVACVGTASGAIPDVIGDAGLIVPERNIEALAEALGKLCQSDELRCEMKARARAFALERYTAEAIAGQYFLLFKTIVCRSALSQNDHA